MNPGDAQKSADASSRFRQPDGRYSCYMTDVPCEEGAFTEAHVDAILRAWGADPATRYVIEPAYEGRLASHTMVLIARFSDGLWHRCAMGGSAGGEPTASSQAAGTAGETGPIAYCTMQLDEIENRLRALDAERTMLARKRPEWIAQRARLLISLPKS